MNLSSMHIETILQALEEYSCIIEENRLNAELEGDTIEYDEADQTLKNIEDARKALGGISVADRFLGIVNA